MFKPAERTLRARSVAIVGASERSKWPRDIYASLRDSGYSGHIYPINPKYKEVWGVPCYPIEGPDDLPRFAEAYQRCLDERGPAVALLGAPTS